MQSFSIFFRRPALAALLGGLLLNLHPHAGLAATNAPTIIRQPVGGIAGAGEDFVFDVEADGPPPLTYQWLFNGVNIGRATNSSILLTNLTTAQSGYYSVHVKNTNGTVGSVAAHLAVKGIFSKWRRLSTGRILTNSSSQVAVPIVLRGNGRENAISFSLVYNPATFANPVFLPGFANENVTTDTSHLGAIGVSVLVAPGTVLPPGYIPLGLVQFDLAPGATALQGGLGFSTNPIPITATNAAQLDLPITAAVEPQHVLVTSAPYLDPQSGLFKQQIIVSNPGAEVMINVNILPQTLGHDTLTNRIRFYNGVATLTNVPYGDPLIQIGTSCGCGYALDSVGTNCDFSSYLACAAGASPSLEYGKTNINLVAAQIRDLAPAESRVLTLEYYVSDHKTAPTATYSVYSADRIRMALPASVTPVPVTSVRYLNGTFLVEFPTVYGDSYYIRYADSPSFTNALTAFPPVHGTGSSVQWIDDGPPKTVSPPVSGSRFYRVLQNP